MRRRDLVLASGALALLAAATAGAQAPKPRRIAFLSPSTEKFGRPLIEAFLAKLKELGSIEGRDFVLDKRWAEGKFDRFAPLAGELFGLRPDVIVASTVPSATAFRMLTSTVPIVFISSIDPVKEGFVASLARPGRNMTGTTFRGPAMLDKALEMLRELLPAARRIAMFDQEDDPNLERGREFYRARFAANRLEVEFFPVRQPADMDAAFDRVVRSKPAAFSAAANPFFVSHARRMADLALKARLPLIGTRREFADSGGLMSYDNDLRDDYRRAAVFVDKIFKGAKPADLPVEQPDLFVLVVNLRTAKALGIKVPQSVLLRATEVIE